MEPKVDSSVNIHMGFLCDPRKNRTSSASVVTELEKLMITSHKKHIEFSCKKACMCLCGGILQECTQNSLYPHLIHIIMLFVFHFSVTEPIGKTFLSFLHMLYCS